MKNFTSNLKSHILCLIIMILLAMHPAFSQTGAAPGVTEKPNWSNAPYEHKVFIENKGQFDPIDNNDKANPLLPLGYVQNGIKYVVTMEGTEMYFTNHGLTYRRDETQKLSEKEREKMESAVKATREKRIGDASPIEEGEEEAHNASKKIFHLVSMDWQGANPDPEVIAEDPVIYYYTYGDRNDKSGKSTIKALAYNKITYKNIYPNIDIIYTFPENKTGIKYSIILHPGADASVIKMKYSGQDITTSYEGQSVTPLKGNLLKVDEQGNLLVETSFGNITDHAPITSYGDGTQIESAYSKSGNTVSFKIPPLGGMGAVIDPWTTFPPFSNPGNINRAYSLDYDFAGDVYAYGGSFPFQEIKFDKSGNTQWIYTTTPFWFNYTMGGNPCGDNAVDGISGSSYICEGMRPTDSVYVHCPCGAEIIKLNANGFQVGWYPGNDSTYEMWKISYNNCTKQLYLVTGGWQDVRGREIFTIDTNLTTLSGAKIYPGLGYGACCYHDGGVLALDNTGNGYTAQSRRWANSTADSTDEENVLVRFPASTLLPIDYRVRDHYEFIEVWSVQYMIDDSSTHGIFYGGSGYNGLAVNGCYLYMYDGSCIKRFNKNTGAILDSLIISPSLCAWGGIAVDECNNIYVGLQNAVMKYDSTYTLQSIIHTAGTVYDVQLAPGNLLYVCGDGFVSSFQLKGVSCNNPCGSVFNLVVSSTPDTCSSGRGTATVIPSGGIGTYKYSWNPTLQTTQTATGLLPGVYTVVVIDSSIVATLCTAGNGGGTQTATVTVENITGSPLASAFPDTSVCSGSSVQLHATGGTTYKWIPTTGLSDSTIANPVATVYAPTTYTVTATNPVCGSATATVTIGIYPAPPTPVITQSHDTLFCSTNPVYASYQWYSDTALVPGATDTLYVALHNGNYNIAVTDTNGCMISVGINILTLPPAAAFQSSATSLCSNSCVNFTDKSTGTPLAWDWSFPGGIPSSSSDQNPQQICYPNSGLYTVTLVAANAAGSDTIVINNFIHVSPSPPMPVVTKSNDTLYCSIDPSYTSYQWYQDTTLIAGATNSFYVTNQGGSYHVEVTNEFGCNSSAGFAVGLQDYASDNIVYMYPNPAGDQLMIGGLKFTKETIIDIYNVLGQIILEERVSRSNTAIINVKNLAAGVYFVRLPVAGARGALVRKFVKE